MLQALRAGGVSNYSIYLLDGQLVGVFDVEDFDRFRAFMAEQPVNDRWQADMARLIDPCTDPATGFHRRLEEVFRLD
jgi:L-rhamnose mutarotase